MTRNLNNDVKNQKMKKKLVAFGPLLAENYKRRRIENEDARRRGVLSILGLLLFTAVLSHLIVVSNTSCSKVNYGSSVQGNCLFF